MHQVATLLVSLTCFQISADIAGIVNLLILLVALLTASWTNAADEAAVAAAVTDMYAKANAFAKSKGTLNAFEYLNYAYKSQSPITGYGADNIRKLTAASKKYDPFKIFQNFVPGGFKL